PFGMLTVGEIIRTIGSGRLTVAEMVRAIGRGRLTVAEMVRAIGRGRLTVGERPQSACHEDPDHLLAIGMRQIGVVEWLPGLEGGVGDRVAQRLVAPLKR